MQRPKTLFLKTIGWFWREGEREEKEEKEKRMRMK